MDGYRLIVQRDGKRVRLFTRNGFDWTDKYPLITEAARRIRSTSLVLDGEAVLLGVDGISDFDGLHSRQYNDEVQFYAFDVLVDGSNDLRKLPLHLRKNMDIFVDSADTLASARITDTRRGSLSARSRVVAATASGGATIAPIAIAAAHGILGTIAWTTSATAAVVSPTAISARLATGIQCRFRSRSDVS